MFDTYVPSESTASFEISRTQYWISSLLMAYIFGFPFGQFSSLLKKVKKSFCGNLPGEISTPVLLTC